MLPYRGFGTLWSPFSVRSFLLQGQVPSALLESSQLLTVPPTSSLPLTHLYALGSICSPLPIMKAPSLHADSYRKMLRGCLDRDVWRDAYRMDPELLDQHPTSCSICTSKHLSRKFFLDWAIPFPTQFYLMPFSIYSWISRLPSRL